MIPHDDPSCIKSILDLKKKRDVAILAHNYQRPEVQFIADYVGDTLSLVTLANNVTQKRILFCGPDFMVETTAILTEKPVIYANACANCPMAAMLTGDQLQQLKTEHPHAKVVAYVNTNAECKSQSDICCTASNAVQIMQSLQAEKIIFVPDMNLGMNMERFIPKKQLVIWPGFCVVHHSIEREEILNLARKHPEAEIIVHPECQPDVVEIAHNTLSTDGMLRYVAQSRCTEFIVGTEVDLVYKLSEEHPEKTFYPAAKACRTQKKIRLDHVQKALETLEPTVDLPVDLIEPAKRPLTKMLSFGRGD
jgi:quinolinate synthase